MERIFNTKERIYTQEELEYLCIDFQIRLRLQDWDIAIQLSHQHSMDESMAEIQINWCHKKAIISIPTPETYSSKIDIKQDMLSSLIHELIHLHLESFFPKGDKESKKYMSAEYAINVLSSTLAELYDTVHERKSDVRQDSSTH